MIVIAVFKFYPYIISLNQRTAGGLMSTSFEEKDKRLLSYNLLKGTKHTASKRSATQPVTDG